MFHLKLIHILIEFQAYLISFKDILNGLTWSNIQQRKEEVETLTIDTEERLMELSQLIYKKVYNYLNKCIVGRLSYVKFLPINWFVCFNFRFWLQMPGTCP